MKVCNSCVRVNNKKHEAVTCMDEDRRCPARQGECEVETVRSPLKCVALGHGTHITHSEVLK